MAVKRRNSSQKQSGVVEPKTNEKKSRLWERYALAFVLGVSVAVFAAFLLSSYGGGALNAFNDIGNTSKSADENTPKLPRAVAENQAQAFALLLGKTPQQLAQTDIAEMNLLCATGLPGAEKLNIAKCLARLDEWANKVQLETDRHLYRVNDPK